VYVWIFSTNNDKIGLYDIQTKNEIIL